MTSLCASSPQSGSLCCGCSQCASPLRHRIPPHGQPAKPPIARSELSTHRHAPSIRTRSLGCGHAASRASGPELVRGSVSRSSCSAGRAVSSHGPRPSRAPVLLVWRADLFHHHRHHRLHHGDGPGARPAPAVRLPAGHAASPAGGRGVLRPAERRVQRQREGVHR